MTYEEYDLVELERAVADARAAYIVVANKKQGNSNLLWAKYSRLLFALYLRKRSDKNVG